MKKTQREAVIDYLNTYGSITRLDAFMDLGIAELPARICELEKKGYSFNKVRVPFKSRLGRHSSYIKYSLLRGDEYAGK